MINSHEYVMEKFAAVDWESKTLSEEVPEMHVLSISEDGVHGNYIVLVKYDWEMEEADYLGWSINIPIDNIEMVKTTRFLTTQEALENYLIYMDGARVINETTTTDPEQPTPRDDLM